MPAVSASHGRGGPGGIVGRVALFFGLLSPALAIGGAFAASAATVEPLVGFLVFALSIPVAGLAILVSLIALVRARGDRNPPARRKGLAAITLSVLVLAALSGLVLPAADYPRINDISTDLEDPPAFVTALTFGPNAGKDMSYPVAFVSEQRRGYPTLGPVNLRLTPEDAFERARSALASLPSTTITDTDPEAGRIEAICVSRVFHFVDDVVVRVRSTDDGSRVDVRSKSRDGQGDLGVNANRIEHLFAILH